MRKRNCRSSRLVHRRDLPSTPRIPLAEPLEARVLLAADATPWHNEALPADVNQDTFVSAIDALLIINELNRGGGKQLSAASGRAHGSPFYDVNGDNFLSAIDALLVINRLNTTRNDIGPRAIPTVVDDEYIAQQRFIDSGGSLTVTAANGPLSNDTVTGGGTLTLEVVDTTDNGVLDIQPNGAFTYTPNVNYRGPDAFTYRAKDGTDTSTIATVTITVNGRPVAMPNAYTVIPGGILTVAAPGILGNDSDPDSDPLTADGVGQAPRNGTIDLRADGSFTYTPNSGFAGIETFRYLALDNRGGISLSAEVTISVQDENTAPEAILDGYATTAGTTLTVNAANGLLRNDRDADNNPFTAAVVDSPANGVVNVNANGSFEYTPNAGFSGVDSFTYKINDGVEDSAPATVRVSVSAESPTVRFTLVPTSLQSETPLTTIDQGSEFLLRVYVKDEQVEPDGVFAGYLDVFYDMTRVSVNPSVRVSGGPSYPNGVEADTSTDGVVNEAGAIDGLSPLGGNRFLMLNIPMIADAAGLAVFSADPADVLPAHGVLLFDQSIPLPNSQLVFEPATLQINAGNATPIARTDTYNTNEDTVLTVPAPGVLANDSDPNSLPLTATLGTNPQNGQVVLQSNGSFVYTPNDDFSGPDSFTYIVGNGTASARGTVNITVNPVDDPPTAVDDRFNVNTDQLVVPAPGVLGNDADPENDALTAVLVTDPTNGTLVFNADGSFTYTPNGSFVGTDTFTYRAVAAGAESNVATVTLLVGDRTPGSISGFVYTDVNHDGIRSSTEAPLAGVTIRLQGRSFLGEDLSQTTTTGPNGSYRFSELPRGTYFVSQDHPRYMIDGRDTQNGIDSPVSDQFFIDLPSGANLADYNFGERGLRPEFGGNWILLPPRRPGELLAAIDGGGNQLWYCSSSGWAGFTNVTMQLDPNGTLLTITAEGLDGDDQSIQVPVANNPFVHVMRAQDGGFVVRLIGRAADFGLAPTGLAARAVDAAFSA